MGSGIQITSGTSGSVPLYPKTQRQEAISLKTIRKMLRENLGWSVCVTDLPLSITGLGAGPWSTPAWATCRWWWPGQKVALTDSSRATGIGMNSFRLDQQKVEIATKWLAKTSSRETEAKILLRVIQLSFYW